jgi:hypothetical protein
MIPDVLVGQESGVVSLKPGDHVRVEAPRLYNDPVIGDIEALIPDTLILAVSSVRTIALPVGYISKIEKRVESGGIGVKGALLGGVAGAALGAGIGSSGGGPASLYLSSFVGAFGGFVVGGLLAGSSSEWVEVSLGHIPPSMAATIEIRLRL